MPKKLLRILLALIFTAGGVNHFLNPTLYIEMMPGYMPFPGFLVWLSGMLEVAGGIGLMVPANRKQAAWLIIFLLVAFLPVHVHHIVSGGQFSPTVKIPLWAAWVRICFQPVLIGWAWWVRK